MGKHGTHHSWQPLKEWTPDDDGKHREFICSCGIRKRERINRGQNSPKVMFFRKDGSGTFTIPECNRTNHKIKKVEIREKIVHVPAPVTVMKPEPKLTNPSLAEVISRMTIVLEHTNVLLEQFLKKTA
jgi:hypothetical protein